MTTFMDNFTNITASDFAFVVAAGLFLVWEIVMVPDRRHHGKVRHDGRHVTVRSVRGSL